MPTKVIVQYEETIHLEIEQVFNLVLEWLQSQYKSKIGKKTKSPSYIDAKQGTMNTSTGYDPMWRKRIRINFFDIKGQETLVRVHAQPIARNIRSSKIEKLKLAWWNGLFSGLFSLLVKMEHGVKKTESDFKAEHYHESQVSVCPNCGKEIEKNIIICPFCGIEVN